MKSTFLFRKAGCFYRLFPFVLAVFMMVLNTKVMANEKPDLKLYARAALLMDATNGRVLYEENGYSVLPMASTTKIMTCMIALESGKMNEYCEVSKNAVAQPKVKLFLKEKEEYLLEDLLYSLMLESHNDSAVVIAEHVAGSVDAFCQRMNEKAVELGCCNTCFLTPNGLDAKKGNKIHSTTAYELGLIAAWAIKNEEFVKLINTRSYAFTDKSGKHSCLLQNKDRFLEMEKGAIGIKTGFTGGAGYCFVGAVKIDGKTLISVVLGSGWPPNKNWKWNDTRVLMQYGKEKYEYRDITVPRASVSIPVEQGIRKDVTACVRVDKVGLLMSEFDTFEERFTITECLNAPVAAGTVVGQQEYFINGEPYAVYDVVTVEFVPRKDYLFCFKKICRLFSL